MRSRSDRKHPCDPAALARNNQERPNADADERCPACLEGIPRKGNAEYIHKWSIGDENSKLRYILNSGRWFFHTR